MRTRRLGMLAAAGLLLSACYGDGVWNVGTGENRIPPGVYSAPGGVECYWARFAGSVTVGNLAGENFGVNHIFVTVAPTDTHFLNDGCGAFTAPQAGPYTKFPNALVESDQDHRVGIDMMPGTWRSSGSTECYWARLRDWRWQVDDSSVIDTGVVTGPATVTVAPTDVGFESFDCGGWVKIA